MKKILIAAIIVSLAVLMLLVLVIIPKGSEIVLNELRGPTITAEQYAAVQVGDSRSAVLEDLGPPAGIAPNPRQDCAFYLNKLDLDSGEGLGAGYYICFEEGVVASKRVDTAVKTSPATN